MADLLDNDILISRYAPDDEMATNRNYAAISPFAGGPQLRTRVDALRTAAERCRAGGRVCSGEASTGRAHVRGLGQLFFEQTVSWPSPLTINPFTASKYALH